MVRAKVVKMSQIIGYIFKVSEKPRINRVKLIKLIWAADRYHIRKYGRLVSGDVYYAMRHGPVSSLALDIAQLTEWKFNDDEYAFLEKFFNSDKKDTWVEGGVTIDDDYLSETDKEAIEFSWKTFGKFDNFYLADEISHRYPEWRRLENHFVDTSSPKARPTINDEDFFENPDNDEFFNIIDEDHLAASKEYYRSQEAIRKILGE